jgi:long-chain fatty acid transport protein
VGASYQRIDATFTNQVNYSAALARAAGEAAIAGQIPSTAVQPLLAATPGLEAGVKIDGDDSAWGWNAGVLFDLDGRSRIGAHYRSSIKYHIAGNVAFDRPSLPALPASLAPVGAALANGVNGVLSNGGVHVDIELPAIANLSYFRRVSDRWDVMADVQWTGWDSVSELRFVRNNGTLLSNTPENFKDVWRYSIGANYRYSDRWMFRGGLAYDESPVNDEDRTPRLPDESRVWMSVGAQYAITPHLKLDAGFSYIIADDASIDQAAGNPAANGLIRGSYDASVTIFSGQLTYTF